MLLFPFERVIGVYCSRSLTNFEAFVIGSLRTALIFCPGRRDGLQVARYSIASRISLHGKVQVDTLYSWLPPTCSTLRFCDTQHAVSWKLKSTP